MEAAADDYSISGTLQDLSSSTDRYTRLQDLKVDTPITPHHPYAVSSPSTVGLADEVLALLPAPEFDPSMLDPRVANSALGAFVDEFIRPAAGAAIERVENEKLDEIDTTMRVPVPEIADELLPPPWLQYLATGSVLNAQRGLLRYIKREMLKDECLWGEISKLERSLTWAPFPTRLGKVQLTEDVDDDRSAEQYMVSLTVEEPVDLHELVGTTASLRILDNQESDDEDLEDAGYEMHTEPTLAEATQSKLPSLPIGEAFDGIPLSTPTHALLRPPSPKQERRLNMESLLRKRKLELEASAQSTTRRILEMETLPSPELVNKLAGADASATDRLTFDPSLGHSGLMGFLQTRGYGARGPQGCDFHLQRQKTAPAAIMVSPLIHNGVEKLATDPTPVPVPELVEPERPMQIAVSSKLSANRSFTRRLQTLLPNLELIERDDLRGGYAIADKHAQTSGLQEADLTVSPALGVVLTTLQKLKQQPLPGQQNFFGVRERIAVIALRYERVIVIVSEGCEDLVHSQCLDDRACSALAEFISYSSYLSVEAMYLPGGEKELVSWVASVISIHAVDMAQDGQGVGLLQDETLWERFLRTAGMNAFAAQIVLSRLKKAHNDMTASGITLSSIHSVDRDAFGLAIFVTMSVRERIQTFAPLLGGERVLTRVSEVIDRRWVTNAAMR
ncbi:hypothetical protein BAUCODRAFT_126707 [Baudoinia panamericana UAMH 10762]|uniref:Uncharacterized protein n=1 Tax=Baudoinia panamericana (strain UAMH 10762) TaxID=717646 RepID=M2MZF0_BAUPA|nr:uncharacterized protein BAUCODRAFT_126707 [Baudoinia panamericana UAMH 10762]EMC91710.1 hypothetical protein BAUCODRAFT_126707 [Baudoinia panamericana UAMH 10762]